MVSSAGVAGNFTQVCQEADEAGVDLNHGSLRLSHGGSRFGILPGAVGV
jgi:hypothetical protein